MRRISGVYEGVEHIVLESDHSLLECPSNLAQLLRQADGKLPTGETLVEQCRRLFGDTLQVREV